MSVYACANTQFVIVCCLYLNQRQPMSHRVMELLLLHSVFNMHHDKSMHSTNSTSKNYNNVLQLSLNANMLNFDC